MARKSKKKFLKVIHPDCAGIDIGGSEHWVAVDPDCCDKPVQSFTSFTDDLERMADWLASLRVKNTQALAHYDFLEQQIAECDQTISEDLARLPVQANASNAQAKLSRPPPSHRHPTTGITSRPDPGERCGFGGHSDSGHRHRAGIDQ